MAAAATSQMFDKGSGQALIVIPGLQGRWEWMAPALEQLTQYGRVVSYSLAPAKTFDDLLQQLDAVFEAKGLGRAVLCGVSFGGTIAVRYAALHPERVSRLVIVSSPGPEWRANAEQTRYVSRPLLTLPLFLLAASRRLRAELGPALPSAVDRMRFAVRAGLTAVRYPASPHLMAERVRLMQTIDLGAEARRVTAPTLVVTGHPSLDLVVPVESTRQYLTFIRGSRYEMMETTGHAGSLTQPLTLARLVGDFVNANRS